MVLPNDVSRVLGIRGETEIVCGVVGNKVILEKFSIDSIYKALAELDDGAPSLELDAVEVKGEDKYVEGKYALRKIGVRGVS